MALRSWFVVACGLLWLACDGDSSSTIKVYGSGSPVSEGGMDATGGTMATGGYIATGGRMATGGTMATGGQNSAISVPGGIRDTQSTQCEVSADGCPVGADYLSCMNRFCAKNLATCYAVSETGAVLGGTCAYYAKCQMGCPCDNTRGACETKCYLAYVQPDPACTTCMYNVLSCASKNDCGSPVSCGAGGSVASGGGSMGGMGGAMAVGGSMGGLGGAISRTGGTIPGTGGRIVFPPDAGPIPPVVGPYCSQAMQCCQTLPITVGSPTQLCTVVASASESLCLQILQNFQATGLCKLGFF